MHDSFIYEIQIEEMAEYAQYEAYMQYEAEADDE
jgi:hypothetical protein